jgi:hypothetical protein
MSQPMNFFFLIVGRRKGTAEKAHGKALRLGIQRAFMTLQSINHP